MTEAPTLLERLALSQISGDLCPHEERQTAIDRVCAIGFAPVLGSYLIRIKGGNDAASYNDAREILAWRLFNMGQKHGWGPISRMLRVAEESLRFYVFDMCKTCEGRGVLAHSYSGPAEQDAGTVCPTCSGTTKASRSVRERAVAILKPGETVRRLEKILEASDAIVGRSERIATGISRWKLYGSDYGT